MLPGRIPGQAVAAEGFAVVDVEATGRSPWRHRVVEVAVVLLDRQLRTEAEFATLLDPVGPVGPTHVHRIAQTDVAGAPRFREVAPYLLELLSGRVLVGHHVTCDQSFLDREFARIGVPWPAVPLLCTMRLARAHLPGAGGFGLAACADAAGLGWYPAHTALGDARATADLLRHCIRTRSCPPAAWAEPLREAVGVSWPRLPRARSQPDGAPLGLIRREAPAGPRQPGGRPPAVAPTDSGAMGHPA
ncbi:exonuclease domain-containing protein [Kitasatospora sp. NBC_00315]|uniref:3'-5' exonuclease n=1 Tax=Kitasatospora sp. NBC_00315 TaxID=2975963 RepID=UPI003244FD10